MFISYNVIVLSFLLKDFRSFFHQPTNVGWVFRFAIGQNKRNGDQIKIEMVLENVKLAAGYRNNFRAVRLQ